MTDWYTWIQNIAVERVDDIERYLHAHPDQFPQFTEASEKLDAAMAATDAEHDGKMEQRDDLWISYSAAQAVEMYLAGARDGGRIYHAFITGELPTIQKPEEISMNRLTQERLEALRKEYPKGCRVRLNHMADPYRPDLKAGTMGTVIHVDDMGTIHVSWDIGSSLGVVYSVDSCTRIDAKEDDHD